MSTPVSLEADRLARIALSRLVEPGDLRLSRLVGDLGAVRVRELLTAPEALFGAEDEQALQADIEQRLAGLDPAAELANAERIDVRYVIPGDPEWPAQLDDLDRVPGPSTSTSGIGGAPLGLWVRGPLALSDIADSISIVGSRSATTYGTDRARDLGIGIAQAGWTVVSGAAVGIDQAAHRGAIVGGGTTVAVLACGPDRVYPSAHRALIDHIGQHGLVITELPMGCAPLRHRFLSRNRIIAALSRATVVVEAALRSGALNSARWAESINRPVLGVPGPTTSASSAGVHQLLRQQRASLACTSDDVLEVAAPAGLHLQGSARAPETIRDRLSGRDAQVLDGVPVTRGAAIDSIARASGVAVLEVSSALGRLQQQGLVLHGDDGWRLSPASADATVPDAAAGASEEAS